MATLTQLGTSNLALKGAGDDYNYINRFFATKAEADTALGNSSWVPVAGRLNACLTGDQGLLIYNATTSALDLADEATRAYVDTKLAALTGDAPDLLNTLGEISDALNDDPAFFTNAAAARVANTNLINAESGRAIAAEAAIQADVDANETAINDALVAAAAANEAHIDNVASLVGVAKDGVNFGTFSGSTINDNQTLKTILQTLETKAETTTTNLAASDVAIGLRATIADPNFTGLVGGVRGKFTNPSSNASDHGFLVEQRSQGNFGLRVDTDRLGILVSSTDDAAADVLLRVGDSAANNKFEVSGGKTSVNNTLSLGGVDLTASAAEINFVDGVTSAIQTQLNAIQADVNTNESDADTAIAAVQSDVDQNEHDSDAAFVTLQADVDANEAAALTARNAIQADVDQNEADADTAIAAVQTDVDNNEAASIASLALKAPLASPALTGTPTAPTAGAGANTTQLATTAYVEAAIATLVDSAPGAINTLNELAAAVADDANFSTTITNAVNAVQADVNQNEIDADNAIAAVQTDVNAKYLTHANSIAAVQADVNLNESDADTAIAAVQTDVDANEVTAANAVTAENTAMLAAVAVVQADVDANQVTAADAVTAENTAMLAAVAAVQADVNANETASDDAETALVLVLIQ